MMDRREPGFGSLPQELNFQWRGRFENDELNALHADAFGHELESTDWQAQAEKFSLGWITARGASMLAGFVNVAWDGAAHAFLLDLAVHRSHQHRGVGTRLVRLARRHAQDAGCKWLQVDFERPLHGFYVRACGFQPSDAGVLRLGRQEVL